VQKTVPTVGRLLVMVGFALSCFGLLLFLWLAFGGSIPLKPKGYRFKVDFQEATSLAQEADVTISGVRVGKVKKLESGSNGATVATIEMKEKYAPVSRDARAILRQKTLLGETYVELTPGTKNGPKVKENATLPAAQVSPTVELDEIFRAFDDKTRASFQQWMQNLAIASRDRGQDISDALGNLAPFATDTNELLTVLNSQQDAVRRLVRNTGVVFDALTERDGQLRSLIENSNRVFAVTAARDQQLKETFIALPTFQDESRKTLARLATFARQTNPLVTQLRPAARELSPTLVDLAGLAPDLNGFFRDLNPLIDASRKGFPATRRFLDDLRPLLGQLDPFLRSLNPVIEGLGFYQKEISAFFANSASATQAAVTSAGRAPLHYLRTTNPLNPENLAVYPARLPTNRPNPYQFPGVFSDLGQGLKVYENRHCNRAGTPSIAPPSSLPAPISNLLPDQLRGLIDQYALNSNVAPPCVLQDKFPSLGSPSEQTQYPHVHPDARPAP
jgi:phospholipid/cholesterol/gamma-HCH transport system substrate-binding protein